MIKICICITNCLVKLVQMVLHAEEETKRMIAYYQKMLKCEVIKNKMQEKYWNYMVQIKAWTFYLDIYAEDSYKWDRRINIYGAIASSSSIAAWTIWRNWSFIWAAIIAISQVLTAIKQYLPFGRKVKISSTIY